MSFKPSAFLSYTRIDDEFFGGGITSLCKLLELGVQVATGNRGFSIFQDVEGIKLGQNFANRIDEAIGESIFLIPILTPLFFGSSWCRDELSKFLHREKSLGRTDLILPVYYVTSPLLEKSEQTKHDKLAVEINQRERFDWRENADLPANDPRIRKSILALSGQIALALDRVASAERSVETADVVRGMELKAAAEVLAHSANPKPQAQPKTILWVDDRPDNNIFERKAFGRYSIDFVLARSTEEALPLLAGRHFGAIISDMGRPPDYRAGYTLLDLVRQKDGVTPFFIYAGSQDPKHIREALAHGAQGCTNIASELIQLVLSSISPELGIEVQRSGLS